MRLTREKTVRLSHRIVDFLVSSADVDFVEDRDTIRQEIVNVITSLLKVEEQVDTEVRAKIASQKKEILEGSEEWDLLYRKYYAEGLQAAGRCRSTRALNSLHLLSRKEKGARFRRAPFLFYYDFSAVGYQWRSRLLSSSSVRSLERGRSLSSEFWSAGWSSRRHWSTRRWHRDRSGCVAALVLVRALAQSRLVRIGVLHLDVQFDVLQARLDDVELRSGHDVLLARRKNRRDLLLRRFDAIGRRRVRRENLGDRSRLLLLVRFDLFKEHNERVGIVPGLVHVLQAEVVRFALHRRGRTSGT